jgi:alcohol dehydrogenase class IV
MANDAKSFDDLDALHATSTHPKEDMRAPSVPIICVPTSLSGGEYNHRGGGSNDNNHRKYSFAHPLQRPKLVILDPELTRTTPDRWWISSGVRAVDHCVEAMCALNAPPECDRDSSKGLRLLVPGLLKCKKNNQDLDARFNCQLGVIESTKAGSLYGVGKQIDGQWVSQTTWSLRGVLH